jgi:hypothetical protein
MYMCVCVCVCVCVCTYMYMYIYIYGGGSPLAWGFGGNIPEFCFLAHGFLISVKEFRLLTNPGQLIRGLDDTKSYICIVL